MLKDLYSLRDLLTTLRCDLAVFGTWQIDRMQQVEKEADCSFEDMCVWRRCVRENAG